ncbi:MAG: TIGR00295 family protein [Candidatus Methanoperedenaceae archaeon]|nr:TIGR00295 family protein [Candidatus Methanoperedenaceae archaeon]
MNETDAIALLVKCGCSRDVIEHSKTVAEYAREIAASIIKNAKKKGHPLNIDIDAVFLGGLLHDIGRSKTHGIDHAVTGAAIALQNGLGDKVVNIIERHIGAGITVDEASVLGLPQKDYLPVAVEEKIVAHADNLVFGSRIGTLDELVLSLRKKRLDGKIIQRIIELNNEICAMMR